MTKCDTCGNVYPRSMHIEYAGNSYTFDCFECAIQMLAPACAHCSCRIIGHGVEHTGRMFCCEHCARESSPRNPAAGLASLA